MASDQKRKLTDNEILQLSQTQDLLCQQQVSSSLDRPDNRLDLEALETRRTHPTVTVLTTGTSNLREHTIHCADHVLLLQNGLVLVVLEDHLGGQVSEIDLGIQLAAGKDREP